MGKLNKILVIFVLLATSFVSCNTEKEKEGLKEQVEILTAERDSLQHLVTVLDFENKSIFSDTVVVVKTDTMYVSSAESLVAMYKLERIKFYIDITESNPNNRTFFYGWVKRAVAE